MAVTKVTSYEGTTGTNWYPIYGPTGADEIAGQGFQVQANCTCVQVTVYIAKVLSPTDNTVLRIETDNAGVPSGTLVDANATKSISSAALSTSHAWVDFTFATPFNLTANTQYHVVITRDGARSQTNYVGWDYRTETYNYGVFETRSTGTWAGYSGDVHSFIVYANTQNYTSTLNDSISSSDNLLKLRGIILNFNDSISSSDSKTQKLGYGQIYLDQVTLSDILSLSKLYSRFFNDSFALSDFLERVARLSQTFNDSMTLTDIIEKSQHSPRTLQDAITLLDIFQTISTLSKNYNDTISLNEKDFDIIYTDRDIIEISADPQIQAGTQGQFLSLQYVTDYPKLRWVDGRGLKLFKGKDFTMNSGSIINFIYDSANQVWNETSRMQDIYTLQGEG